MTTHLNKLECLSLANLFSLVLYLELKYQSLLIEWTICKVDL
jgi:hypothetical protein